MLLSILPAALLAYVWISLPDQVPMHWDLNGNVDRYGNKSEMLLFALIPIFVYFLLLIIPVIDPKKRLNSMGSKFYSLRLITTVFISVLFLFIIYSVKEQSLSNPNYIFAIIGAFFMILGNYFTTIKPNYFMGIRTPWTLESEIIWKSTHRMAAKLWILGGLIIVITSFILPNNVAQTVFLGITILLVVIPILFSYQQYRKGLQKVQ